MNANSDFAAIIGLDWADQKHDLWLRPADGAKSEHLRVEQTPEALHEWVAKLGERFGRRRVAIGIETSRGPVISALLAYDFIVFFPINPKALKDYRAAFAVSGAKDDRTDAMLLEEFVRLHRDKLRALEPDTPLTRKLGGLTENRRRLVDERTRQVNQMHSVLKTYYPLAETLLGGHMTTPMAADFLARWPDLAALQKADPKTLRAFFYKHNSRGAEKMEKRLAAAAKARPLTEDEAIIAPARHLATALAAVLKALHHAIAAVDKDMPRPSTSIPTRLSSAACPVPARPWPRACWWPLAPNATVLPVPPRSPSFMGSPPSSNKAATLKRSTCAAAAPSSAARLFMKTPAAPSKRSRGPNAIMTTRKANPTANTTRPAGLWPTNSSASITPAGNTTPLMTASATSKPWKSTAAPSTPNSRPYPPKKVNNSQKIIDGITQNSPEHR